MWGISLKVLRANLSRFVATLIAIATGVGFLTAGTMVTNSIESSLGGEIDRQYAGVDLAVQPADIEAEQGLPRTTLPSDILDEIAAVKGVAHAAGVVVGSTKLPAALTENDKDVDEDDSEDLFAIGPSVRAWIDDGELNPLDLVDGVAPGDGEVTVDQGLAEEHDIGVGDALELATVSGFEEYTVSGITAFGTSDSPDPGGTITSTTPGVFALGGFDGPTYTDVLIRVEDGSSVSTVQGAVRSVLADMADSGDLRVVTGATYREDAKGQFATVFDILRPVLQGFSGLAIFVCAFVIFNTFTVVVSQRIRELALMRAIAATPKQIRKSLYVEGLGIGLLGSILGLGLGTLLTVILSRLFVALDIDLPDAHIVLTPGIVITGLIVGTLVTLVSVLVPAFRAGRTAPVEAMRASAIEPTGVSKKRLITAACFLGIGVLLMLPANGFLVALGAPLMVIGVFLMGPAFAYWFATGTRAVLRRFGMAGRLSSDNIARNPKRTSTTMNALVVGLLLVTLVTVAGNSLKRTTVAEINKLSSADFIVSSLAGEMDAGLVEDMQAVDGITGFAALRQRQVGTASGNLPPFLSVADPDALESIGIEVDDGSLADLGDDGVAVASFDGSMLVGDRIGFLDPTVGPVEFEVKAVLAPSLDTFSVGSIISPEAMDRLAPGLGTTGALIKVDSDERDAVASELKTLTAGYGNVLVQSGNIVGQFVEAIFDFLINAVNGLLGMSIVIALIGIVNTLTLSIFERRRELGLLRAVGMTAQGVRRMIRLEALQMAILGTVVGIASGLLLGFLLLRASDLGSLDVQWDRMAVLLGIGLLIGIIASIVPTRRVTKLNVLEAIEVT